MARRLVSAEALRFAAVLAGVSALGGGAIFADVEHRSTWDGVWWSVMTGVETSTRDDVLRELAEVGELQRLENQVRRL